jgi:hypothetical protein
MGKGNIHTCILWSVIRNITLLNITLIPRTSTPKLQLKRCWNSSSTIFKEKPLVRIFVKRATGLPTVYWDSHGTNCAALLADLFLHSCEAEIIQKTLYEKKKSLAVAFSSTFRYIDDVLSTNNNQIHSYVDLASPNKLEMKDSGLYW